MEHISRNATTLHTGWTYIPDTEEKLLSSNYHEVAVYKQSLSLDIGKPQLIPSKTDCGLELYNWEPITGPPFRRGE